MVIIILPDSSDGSKYLNFLTGYFGKGKKVYEAKLSM